jgi:hypothetical protein
MYPGHSTSRDLADDLARIPFTEPMTSIRPSAGFGSIRTPERPDLRRVDGVKLPGGAQRDRLGADLKDPDLGGQRLD